MSHWPPTRLEPGRSHPLGATWDGLGTNFAVFSAHAERIDLCLFDPSGRREIARLPLPECTDEVWHGYLPGAQPGLLYGLRAHGPFRPQQGHRFNPHKLLLDPYARQLAGPLRWSDTLFGYRLSSRRADLSLDRRDSAPAMPKCVVVGDSLALPSEPRLERPWAESVVYELHVRGVSMQREDILPPLRGTFAALADPRFIEHLLRLGVTAVELMPVHAFLQDRFLVEKGLRNYWGYSTLSYFAAEPSYSSRASQAAGRTREELRLAVRQFHAAGIEVLLDVVYNHTCEGSELGPTLSWRGLDNASYYRLMPGEERYYINDTGCGNTVNLSHPRVLQMVMDSLRYWVGEIGVDGFRFDLGTTLGREAHGFDPGSGFFDAIRQDPTLAACKLISEPWDIGPGGYQVGQHPPGFAEWNDRFRDGARRLWRGDAHARNDFAARLCGSADLFSQRHRRPWASVNYVASHDGFTLADTVSYAQRHNEANGEQGRDGHGENLSSNWVGDGRDPAHDGPNDDPLVQQRRERVQRALLAMPFVSLGTPMLLCGDEFGRTQQGNNNAYCQDNALSWVDWTRAETPEGTALSAFTAHLTRLRRDYPLLREQAFLTGTREMLPGVHDVDWFDEHGEALSPQAWDDPKGRAFVCRRAGPGPHGGIDLLLLVFNPDNHLVSFTLPAPGHDWHIELDTIHPARRIGERCGTRVALEAHGLLVLAASRTR